MTFGNKIFIPRGREKESKMLNMKSITLRLKLKYHYEYIIFKKHFFLLHILNTPEVVMNLLTMRTAIAQILVSKNHFPWKETSSNWRNDSIYRARSILKEVGISYNIRVPGSFQQLLDSGLNNNGSKLEKTLTGQGRNNINFKNNELIETADVFLKK